MNASLARLLRFPLQHPKIPISTSFPVRPPPPRAFPRWRSGELIFVAFQLMPLPSIRGSWWLSDMSPWFAGAMLFQVRKRGPQTVRGTTSRILL